MDEDFEYDTGRAIPRDSAGWREFEFNRMKKLKDFLSMSDVNPDDAFFRVPWRDQVKLQQQHPVLAEAWNHYIVLLSMIYEEQNGTRP
jgi:hypothetical protein